MKKVILILMVFVLTGCTINVGVPGNTTNNTNSNSNDTKPNTDNSNPSTNNQNKTPGFVEQKFYGQSNNVYAEIEYKFNRIDDVSFDFNGPDDMYDAMSDSVEHYIEINQRFPNEKDVYITDIDVFNDMKAAFEQAYNNIK